jgi:hypothetical protein
MNVIPKKIPAEAGIEELIRLGMGRWYPDNQLALPGNCHNFISSSQACMIISSVIGSFATLFIQQSGAMKRIADSAVGHQVFVGLHRITSLGHRVALAGLRLAIKAGWQKSEVTGHFSLAQYRYCCFLRIVTVAVMCNEL